MEKNTCVIRRRFHLDCQIMTFIVYIFVCMCVLLPLFDNSSHRATPFFSKAQTILDYFYEFSRCSR